MCKVVREGMWSIGLSRLKTQREGGEEGKLISCLIPLVIVKCLMKGGRKLIGSSNFNSLKKSILVTEKGRWSREWLKSKPKLKRIREGGSLLTGWLNLQNLQRIDERERGR